MNLLQLLGIVNCLRFVCEFILVVYTVSLFASLSRTELAVSLGLCDSETGCNFPEGLLDLYLRILIARIGLSIGFLILALCPLYEIQWTVSLYHDVFVATKGQRPNPPSGKDYRLFCAKILRYVFVLGDITFATLFLVSLVLQLIINAKPSLLLGIAIVSILGVIFQLCIMFLERSPADFREYLGKIPETQGPDASPAKEEADTIVNV